MKILVLSLLRVGDIFLHTPVLCKLREENPDAQLDLAINKQFSSVSEMLPTIDNFWFLDRKNLQDSLILEERNILEAYDNIQALVDGINLMRYDKVINLTHNLLSARLMDMIQASEKVGLQFAHGQVGPMNSLWFDFFNKEPVVENYRPFHFVDLLLANHDKTKARLSLSETDEGQLEAMPFLSDGQAICIQPLTSDTKKNWGLKNFFQVVKNLAIENSDLNFTILAAPNEKAQLEPFMVNLKENDIRARLAVVSLAGALSILKRAKLLITGDTSIKHLASATDCQVVEICVGSSHPFETGVYQADSLILQTKELCSPCQHSKDCYRSEHFCSQRVEADTVSTVVQLYLENKQLELAAFALSTQAKNQIKIYRVNFDYNMRWQAIPVDYKISEGSEILKLIERACLSLYLKNPYTLKSTTIADETRSLLQEIEFSLPATSPESILEVVGLLDLENKEIENVLEQMRIPSLFKSKMSEFAETSPTQAEYTSGTTDTSAYLAPLLKKMKEENFQFSPQFMLEVNATKQRLLIRKSIVNLIKKIGGFYESRAQQGPGVDATKA